MNTQELLDKFNGFKEQVENLRVQLQETGEKFLIENFKETFEKYPKLERISWSQYTPYFNDGEECTFSSNHDYAEIEGEGIKDGDETYRAIEEDINKFLSQFDDELLKSLFGDHVQIIVTKEGISIEEYDHD